MSDDQVGDGDVSGPARRRYLTIVFSDLSNSTSLASVMEAEHYGEVLSALRQVYREVIPRHGGLIARIQGDGLLAIFGHPDAAEDDGRRATEAALELHGKVKALKIDALPADRWPLELHTGIHAGLVLIDDGDLMRGRFDLFGDVPNVAARLSEAAQRGDILVSADTLGPARHFFLTGALRELSLRGRRDDVGVYAILGRARVNTRLEARAHRGLARFVGRRQELAVLTQRMHAALAGQPRCLAISAPSGLGKTRLANEFMAVARSQGWQVHHGYCESYLSAEPLQPFLHILRNLCGLQHGMSARAGIEAFDAAVVSAHPDAARYRGALMHALSLLPESEGAMPAAPPDGERTVPALRALFAILASQKPLLLFIDDWQWADDATRHVVTGIRSLHGHAIMVLLAIRTEAAADAHMQDAELLHLAPFSELEATETIGNLLPSIDPFLLAEIRNYAGGSPLFIEELCHSVADAKTAERRKGRLPSGSAWLDSLIESRLTRLPKDQVELARIASVIGNVIPLWLLQRLTGCSEGDPRLTSLAMHDFIFPGEQPGTLRFKHAIARDAIYQAVGLQQRKALHLRVAEALRASADGEEACEALALHFSAAGRIAEAAVFAELAGHKAVAVSALDRAKVQYRAALAALDRLPAAADTYRRWISIAQRLGLACVFDASREELAVFQRALQRATEQADLPAIARALYWLGYISYALGDSLAAVRHCEQALAWSRHLDDDPLTVQINATLGQARTAMADYDQALDLLDGAIAVKRRHRSGARPAVGLAYSLACKASVLGDRGLFSQAQECFEEALDAVRGANHEVEASTRGLRSAVYLWQGLWTEARQSAADAYRIGEQVRSLYSFAMSRAAGAYAHWMLERKPESLQTIVDATLWLAPREGSLFRSLNHGWLADGAVACGHFVEARGHMARALAQARKRDLIGVAMAYRAMALAAEHARDRMQAERYLRLAMATADARGSAHERAVTRLCEARIALAFDERARAARSLEAAVSAFESMQMPWHLAESRRLAQLA